MEVSVINTMNAWNSTLHFNELNIVLLPQMTLGEVEGGL